MAMVAPMKKQVAEDIEGQSQHLFYQLSLMSETCQVEVLNYIQE